MPERPRVLVGEDDEATRAFFRDVLIDQGYVVEEAADGDATLEAMRREAPALVLLDIVMPRRTGWGVVAEMQRDPDLAGIPVLVVTGQTDEDFRRRVDELGLAGYVVKPVGARELINAVRDGLHVEGDVWS